MPGDPPIGKGSVPIPDPTLLTTQQLIREIASLKEVVFTRLDAMDMAMRLFNENITRVPTDTDKQIQHLKELHESRFKSMEDDRNDLAAIVTSRLDDRDKAIRLLQGASDKFPQSVDEKVASLARVHDERFNSIQTQFRERDVRTEQSSKDSKVAVDAALQAAKEAVGEQNKSSALAIAKSEMSTTKQIDQLGSSITAGNKAMDDKIGDLKDRVNRMEGSGVGRASLGSGLVTVILAAVAVVSVVIAILAYVHKP